MGAAGRDVRLIEALEDVVRGSAVVQVVALIERARLEQLVALAAHVPHFEHHVRRQARAESEVVLLHAGRLEIAIDGAELERLRDVAADGSPVVGSVGFSVPSAPLVTDVPSRIW